MALEQGLRGARVAWSIAPRLRNGHLLQEMSPKYLRLLHGSEFRTFPILGLVQAGQSAAFVR